MHKHFVTFYSPGTFVTESTTKGIASWDPEAARKMAEEISERYEAKPYGFRFTTRTRGDDDLDSKVTATSPMYYFGCRVRTVEQVEARNDPKERILLANMKHNEWKRIVEPIEGWKWSQHLESEDIVMGDK